MVCPLFRFITFLVFGCFGFVLLFVFLGHVLPAFTEDFANLTWMLELDGLEVWGVRWRGIPKVISGFSFLTESRFS